MKFKDLQSPAQVTEQVKKEIMNGSELPEVIANIISEYTFEDQNPNLAIIGESEIHPAH